MQALIALGMITGSSGFNVILCTYMIYILCTYLCSVQVFIKRTRKLAFHILQLLCLNHSPAINIKSFWTALRYMEKNCNTGITLHLDEDLQYLEKRHLEKKRDLTLFVCIFAQISL